jgi:hypothetical protein
MRHDYYSAYFEEGFRITTTDEGLEIRTTDFHARPLRLDRSDLARFGLSVEPKDHALAGMDDASAELLAGILVTIEKTIAIIGEQRPRSAWAGDLMNLELAREILGGGSALRES